MPYLTERISTSIANQLFYKYTVLFAFCFFLLISFTPLQAKNNFTNSPSSQTADNFQIPLYSILYEQVLSLEDEGNYLEAIRLIPKLYATEIPVESFYVTLENRRQQLLTAIIKKEISFQLGTENYTCSEIRLLFKDFYLNKPDSYLQLVKVSDDIDFKRFCYLMIIDGYKHKGSTLQFTIDPSLTMADPWLISATLFLNRKQKIKTIVPQNIINRWQNRPDLWDEKSTRQTLLYLAQFDSATIKSLEIQNEDIFREVKQLQPVAENNSYITPLMFSSFGENTSYINTFSGTIIQMKNTHQNNKGVVKQWAGDKNHYSAFKPYLTTIIKAKNIQDGALSVEAGFYKLRFNSVFGLPPSGFYGDSTVVEVKKGELVVIPVSLTPAI